MADYQKTNWQNKPSTSTPINQANLNHMEQGIYDAQHTADQAAAGVAELQGLNFAPIPVQTVAEMTDETKIYVYLGAETGYVANHWYYWTGSAWAEGGVYNATAIATDTTLSHSGEAADAKATGDQITDLKGALDEAYIHKKYSESSSGGYDYPFNFVVGVAYTITNTSASTLINARTQSAGGTVIENIVQSLDGGKSIEFTPTSSASVLHIYYQGADGSFEITSGIVAGLVDKTQELEGYVDYLFPLSVEETYLSQYDNKDGKYSKYVYPSGYNGDKTLAVLMANGVYIPAINIARFKVQSSRIIYVSYLNGSDAANGLSRNNAVKTWTKVNSILQDGDTVLFIDPDKTVIHRDFAINNVQIDKSINIIAENHIIMSVSDALQWELIDSDVYKATRSAVDKVIDMSCGVDGYEYEIVGTLNDCKNTNGSYYINGNDIYVHTLTGEMPNDTIHVLIQVGGLLIKSGNTDNSVYIENIDFIGGAENGNVFVCSTESHAPSVFFKNCRFLWARGTNITKDAIYCYGAKRAYFQNCVAAYARSDGFGYAVNNGVSPIFAEINCVAHDNGTNTLGTDDTHNGSTSHNNCHGLRVNGLYYNNMGPNIADVDETMTICLGCDSHTSKAVSDGQNVNYYAGATGAIMYIDGCKTYGSVYDLYAYGTTTINVSNTQYTSTGGGGTINNINI